MSFSRRCGVAATLIAGLASLGASKPGFALQLAQPDNAPMVQPVPAAPEGAATDAAAQAGPESAVATETDHPFATLAEAIAAQDDDTADTADLTCLAGAIYFEAKSEPLAGQLAVANVVLNRTKSGRFPRSVCAVVTQRGQFSFVRGGRVPDINEGAQYRTAVAVARVAMADAWRSPAPNALYFHARRVSPGWDRDTVAAIGNHVFYR